MRKAILMMLLAVASGNAAAEWVKVSDGIDADIYIDTVSIRRTGNIVEVVALYDLKTAIVNRSNGIPVSSQKSQTEYDCVERKWRMRQYSWHSKNMGEGKMVESLTDTFEWARVPPGTGANILWEFACGKK